MAVSNSYILYSTHGGVQPYPYVEVDMVLADPYTFFKDMTQVQQSNVIEVSLFSINDLVAVKDYVERGITTGYRKDLFDFFGLIPDWLKVRRMPDTLPLSYLKMRLGDAWLVVHPNASNIVSYSYSDVESVANSIKLFDIKGYRQEFLEKYTEGVMSVSPGDRSIDQFRGDKNAVINALVYGGEKKKKDKVTGISTLFHGIREAMRLPFIAYAPSISGKKRSIYEGNIFDFYLIGRDDVINLLPQIISTINSVQPPMANAVKVTIDIDAITISVSVTDVGQIYTSTATTVLKVHRESYPTVAHLLAALPVDSSCIVKYQNQWYVNDRFRHAIATRANFYIPLWFERPMSAIKTFVNHFKLESKTDQRVGDSGFAIIIPELDYLSDYNPIKAAQNALPIHIYNASIGSKHQWLWSINADTSDLSLTQLLALITRSSEYDTILPQSPFNLGKAHEVSYWEEEIPDDELHRMTTVYDGSFPSTIAGEPVTAFPYYTNVYPVLSLRLP